MLPSIISIMHKKNASNPWIYLHNKEEIGIYSIISTGKTNDDEGWGLTQWVAAA